MRRTFQLTFISATILVLTYGCNGTKSPERVSTDKSQNNLHLVRITQPSNGNIYTVGEVIELELKLVNDSIKPDSIVLFVAGNRIEKLSSLSYSVSTKNLTVGLKQLRATAWLNGQRQTASIGFRLKADKAPKQLNYRVTSTYPHDINAYTQGLFYYNGQLIESTGQNGLSSLRRVELKTGKVLQSVNLDRKYFGEGATYIDDEIYQITWTSRRGFVYNPKTFDLIRTFDYQTQGWGLATINDMLVMSDGSNILYFLEPKSFSEIKRIEVYNHLGPVNQLNELEYINGKVFANVYQTDRIVVINPETGVVEAEIDFAGLLNDSDRHRNIDVLNGIAWDEINQRLFVTGKNWPKLFEIQIF